MKFRKITLRNNRDRVEETSAKPSNKVVKNTTDYSKSENLKQGVWYIYGNDTSCMVKAYGSIIKNYQGKGVWCGTWCEKLNIASTITREATKEEIETMLYKEAEKRGYFKGSFLHSGGINEGFAHIMHGQEIRRNSTNYFTRGDCLDSGCGYIYKGGVWANMGTLHKDDEDDLPF